MLIAVVSAKGAPGVTATCLSLALTWLRPVVLAECDARGSDILAGYGAAQLPTVRGLLELQVQGRNGRMQEHFWHQVVQLPGRSEHRFLLPGLESALQAAAIDWGAIAALFRDELHASSVDVIADCGEVHAQHAAYPVLRAADLVVLVVRATLPAIRMALKTAPVLRGELQKHGMGANRLVAVVIEPKHGYATSEVRHELGRHQLVVAGSLPWDERTARVLTEGTDNGRYIHSSLMTAAASLGRALGSRAHAYRREIEDIQQHHHEPGPQAMSNGHQIMGAGERRG